MGSGSFPKQISVLPGEEKATDRIFKFKSSKYLKILVTENLVTAFFHSDFIVLREFIKSYLNDRSISGIQHRLTVAQIIA